MASTGLVTPGAPHHQVGWRCRGATEAAGEPDPGVLVRPAGGAFLHADGRADAVAGTRTTWATAATAQVSGQAVGVGTEGRGGGVVGPHGAGVALASASLPLLPRAGEGAQGGGHPRMLGGLVAAPAGVELHPSMAEVPPPALGQAATGTGGPPNIGVTGSVREVPTRHAGALPPSCAGESSCFCILFCLPSVEEAGREGVVGSRTAVHTWEQGRTRHLAPRGHHVSEEGDQGPRQAHHVGPHPGAGLLLLSSHWVQWGDQ